MDGLAAGARLAPFWLARAAPTACCKAPGRARSTAIEARVGAGLTGAAVVSRPDEGVAGAAGNGTAGAGSADGTADDVTADDVTADNVTAVGGSGWAAAGSAAGAARAGVSTTSGGVDFPASSA